MVRMVFSFFPVDSMVFTRRDALGLIVNRVRLV